MKDQLGPLLAMLFIFFGFGAWVVGLLAYDRVLAKKRVNRHQTAAILSSTYIWSFLALIASCGVLWLSS